MIGLNEQQELLGLIGKHLKKTMECFVIGGSAMMYHGIKGATKDVDLVFRNIDDRKVVLEALNELGFKEKPAKVLYFSKKNTPLLLQRGDERFDLFSKKIINFVLTDSIASRVSSVYEYGNLVVKIVSPEDIILLKCATERAGDRADAAEIIKRFSINWAAVLEECKTQAKHEEAVFLLLYDFLTELKEDLNVGIPNETIAELKQISEKEIDKTIKKGKGVKTIRYKKGK